MSTLKELEERWRNQDEGIYSTYYNSFKVTNNASIEFMSGKDYRLYSKLENHRPRGCVAYKLMVIEMLSILKNDDRFQSMKKELALNE